MWELAVTILQPIDQLQTISNRLLHSVLNINRLLPFPYSLLFLPSLLSNQSTDYIANRRLLLLHFGQNIVVIEEVHEFLTVFIRLSHLPILLHLRIFISLLYLVFIFGCVGRTSLWFLVICLALLPQHVAGQHLVELIVFGSVRLRKTLDGLGWLRVVESSIVILYFFSSV